MGSVKNGALLNLQVGFGQNTPETKGRRKKAIFFSGRTTRTGGGWTTKEKRTLIKKNCSCLKITYILFMTTYPNINISVLLYCVVGRQTHSI